MHFWSILKMYYFLCLALLLTACDAQRRPDYEDCVTRNGYYKANGTCDAYIECKDYQPMRMICPDGLNFNPGARWPNYPCSYPADVPCIGRSFSQPPQPTADCPRQYGIFRSPVAAAGDCGQYRMCVAGIGYDMSCPYGLAFDPARGLCDWPEFVPDCKSEDFLGVSCPPLEYDQYGNAINVNYSFEDNCYIFYSCQTGRPRLLSCDPGYAFDAKSGICVDGDLVNCGLDYRSAVTKLKFFI